MICFRQTTRVFSSLPKKPFTLPPLKLIPIPGLIDEMRMPWYNDNSFYPAKPGDILADRFQILVKIGYGSSSIVWLARDIRKYVKLTILSRKNIYG